ncbi:MAG: hypothetical protein RDV48_20335 [Candidatus Eremiobacteraeota bacterium]|nr:hypothetical protein [Candidatus Eremiobacteraeota bacterium]
MGTVRNRLIAAAVLFLMIAGFPPGAEAFESGNPPAINLSHLESLSTIVALKDGTRRRVWVIYSKPGRNPSEPYEHVTDPDEGVSCVDDVARAAIVYLRHYKQKGDSLSLSRAREALEFVMSMQTPGGLFINFIFPDGTINREGPTSRASLDFWTIRGFWALAEGYWHFRSIDASYAAKLRRHCLRTVEYLKGERSPLARYGTFENDGPWKHPRWLIGEGTDQTSLALYSLSFLYEADGDPVIKSLMEKLAEGILAAQGNDPSSPLYCSFPSWLPSPTVWHAWGSRQMMALARSGRLAGHPEWIAAAEREANNLVIHLLASEGIIFGLGPAPLPSPSQPYGCEVLTGGLVELHHATGKPHYAVMAGLMASWLMGNNSARSAVYDASTGRVYDGVDGPKLNRNSGAEATVSGLLALMAIGECREAAKYLAYREKRKSSFALWEAEGGRGTEGTVRVRESSSIDRGIPSKNAVMRIEGRGTLVIPFTTADETLVIPSLVMSSTDDAGVWCSIDGNAAVHLKPPLSGCLAWVPMKPAAFAAGSHELTVRRISQSSESYCNIDALVLQPLVEKRTFVSDQGKPLVVLKSFSGEPVTYGKLTIPPYGFSILEEEDGFTANW